MNHHNESTSILRQIIKDMLSIGFYHIHDHVLQLRQLNITEENLANVTEKEKQESIRLQTTLALLNDTVHPALLVAKEMFPEHAEFIAMCEQNVKKGQCICYSCKIKNPV